MRRLLMLLACVTCGGETQREHALPIVDASVAEAVVDLDVVDEPVPITVCPLAPPTVGERCATVNALVCEYGTASSPSCDALYACLPPDKCDEQPPVWQQIGTTKTCPTSMPGCLSSFDEARDAGACDAFAPCTYAAGVCDCAGSLGWECWPDPVSCADPAQRPRLGTACSPDTPPAPPDASVPFAFCPFELDSFSFGSYECFGYVCFDGTVSATCNDTIYGPPPGPCTED